MANAPDSPEPVPGDGSRDSRRQAFCTPLTRPFGPGTRRCHCYRSQGIQQLVNVGFNHISRDNAWYKCCVGG
jgi:hypothetical protein